MVHVYISIAKETQSLPSNEDRAVKPHQCSSTLRLSDGSGRCRLTEVGDDGGHGYAGQYLLHLTGHPLQLGAGSGRPGGPRRRYKRLSFHQLRLVTEPIVQTRLQGRSLPAQSDGKRGTVVKIIYVLNGYQYHRRII